MHTTDDQLRNILSRHRSVLTRPPGDTPSNHFADGPLLGNGDMTAVLAGPGDRQCFYVGKSDFWTDGEGWESTNEEYDHYVVSPLVVGGVRLWLRDFAHCTYRQEIDLERGEVVGRFTGQGLVITTRSWLAATANLLVTHLAIERGPADGAMPTGLMDGAPPLGIRVTAYARRCDDPDPNRLPTQAGADGRVAWAARSTWDRGRWVSRACQATRVLGVGSRCWSDHHRSGHAFFMLQPGQGATIVTALAGGRGATDHVRQACAAALALTPERIDALRGEHERWWLDYWRRSYLDLGGDVVERFWYGAQYALGACARSGCVAPGIFGFNTDDHPRWSGDYHLNYNFEQPFQAACSSNRAEWTDPYCTAIAEFIPEGQRRAAADLSPPMPGVYYPIGLGPWGIAAQDDYMSQKCATAFAACIFIDRFQMTLDPELTRTRLYPFVREAVRFWAAFLRCENGRCDIRGSASHEHGRHDLNTTFDLALVRRLLTAAADMAEFLDADAPERTRWRGQAASLAPYSTAMHEGGEVFKEAENAPGFTRSISLYNVLWPGDGQTGLGGDPRTLATARRTLEAVNLWQQGNSFAWLYPAAARAGLPDLYARLAARLEQPDGLRANLTLAQAHGGIETLGGAATVNEMLLQAHDGTVRLFPAWPRERDASFVRLRARGAFVISAALAGGEVRAVEVHSERGGRFRFVNPWHPRLPVIDRDAPPPGWDAAGEIVAFDTQAGEGFRLSPPAA